MKIILLVLIVFTFAVPHASVAQFAQAGPLDRSEAFQPDVYPSKVQATRGLARPVAEALQGSKEFVEADSTIELIRSGVCDEALDALAHALRSELPGTKLRFVNPPATNPPATGPASVVRIEPMASGPGSSIIMLDVTGGGIDRSFSAQYVDKPWAADWKAFVAKDSKRSWVQSTSPRLAASEAEAIDTARKSAVDALLPIVRQRMSQRNRTSSRIIPESTVRKELATLLRQDKFIEDVFIQRFDRPYGNVYRASVLIDASSKDIDQMASSCARIAQAQLETKTIGWGSAGGFLAVLFLLYMLINSLTRGYFLWRLRAAALLLSIVGILIVLAVT